MKSITQILKEIKALNEKLPNDLEKKVGNVLFGENPAIAKLQKAPAKPEELDTSWEDNLYFKLKTWVNSSGTDVANYFTKNKKLLQTLAKEFPLVLQPPIGKIAYRGTSIKINSLKNAFIKKQYTIVKVGGKEVFRFKDLEYNPNRKSQSWTVDPKIAFKFEGKANNEDSIHVVYAIKVNNDFIFSSELLNIIFDANENEKEVVRVGGKGTFEAFVDSKVFLNTWKLEPKDNFVHKLENAAPFFEPMVDKYNKLADKDNKRFGEKLIKPVKNIESIIKNFGDYPTDIKVSLLNSLTNTPSNFNLNNEYQKALVQFIKSVKNK